MTADTARLREASGSVTDDRPLVAFLYHLLRDHLPAGRVAAIVNEATVVSTENVAEFTNGWLAEYAKDCAARLVPDVH